MNIQGLNFDNTLNIRKFANSPEGQRILDNTLVGNETQIRQVGDVVNGNGYSNATITEIYKQNGFYYYKVQWKRTPKSRTFYNDTLRNKDILAYNA